MTLIEKLQYAWQWLRDNRRDLLLLAAGVLVALFLVAFGAMAQERAREAHNGDDWVRFGEQPCTNAKVIARLPVGLSPGTFRTASAYFQGKQYAACWIDLEDREAIGVLYEDGDISVVPMTAVKEVAL